MSSLASGDEAVQNPHMHPQRNGHSSTGELPLRPQDEVECRRCGVHCDKVVYPGACVERSCPFLYAYEDHGRTYVGCMQKVFSVEIDVDLLAAAERTPSGFGAVRATRKPLPMCPVEVERCYDDSRGGELGCVNPEFFELPADRPSFKVFQVIGKNS